MPPNVTGNFSATGGVSHMDRVLEVKLFCEGCEIVGIRVHLVSVPGLLGAAVSLPVMRDHSIATLAEEQHLSVPVVRGEWPSVTEHDRLAFSPVLVVNLSTILGRNSWHRMHSLYF